MDFSVAGDWKIIGAGYPYGFTSSPTYSGWFTIDDTSHFTVDKSGFEAYPDLVAASVSPGTQVYTALDVDPGYAFLQSDTPGSPFNFFAITFNHPGSNRNYITAFQASLYDGGDAATCDACVTWSVSEVVGGGGVPEPATWAMMIAGFGLAGAFLRRRPLAA